MVAEQNAHLIEDFYLIGLQRREWHVGYHVYQVDGAENTEQGTLEERKAIHIHQNNDREESSNQEVNVKQRPVLSICSYILNEHFNLLWWP